jgi:hypothetical protein
MPTNSSRKLRIIVLLYFLITGLITVLTGIVLNQLNLLPPFLSALATSISGFITIIAGLWVIIERFILPKNPDATPHARLSGREVTGVFLMSIATALLLSTFAVELLPVILGNTPDQVATHFCDVVHRGDSHTAYTQLGSKITAQMSEADFVSNGWFGAEPISCQVTSVQEDGSATIVTVTATISYVPGQGVGLFQLGQENRIWKIDGEAFPSETLNHFSYDIVNGREDTYNQDFSPDLQSQMSPNEFRQMLIDPHWGASYWKITNWSGTQSSFIFQTKSSNGSVGHFSGTLVLANSQWKIQSLQ